MGDLISRQAAIDAIHCDITVTGRQNAEVVSKTIAAFVDRIKALPSAQPEPRWIPCSERNPDETGVYLVTVASNDNKTNTVLFNYSKDYGWTVGGCFTIVAWMPLPEPWEGDTQE